MFAFCFILFAIAGNVYAENSAERLWSEGSHPYEGKTIEVPFDEQTVKYSSDNKLKIKVTAGWPVFQRESFFLQKVNDELENSSNLVFKGYVEKYRQEEREGRDLDEEAISLDFDKRMISYSLTPIYASDSLVSVFGELHWYAGMPHGGCQYSSFNYWFDGKEVHKLCLNSLFCSDKDFSDFITRFCLSTLKNERIGYCNPDAEGHIPFEITLDDMQIFTLSESGLTITFRPYHVGGWADGPYSITMPYESLKPFINPLGPLKEFL